MKKMKFEDGLSQLESIVNELEQGGLSLEESISAYEKGVKLQKTLMKMLADGRQRVEVLTESGELEAME